MIDSVEQHGSDGTTTYYGSFDGPRSEGSLTRVAKLLAAFCVGVFGALFAQKLWFPDFPSHAWAAAVLLGAGALGIITAVHLPWLWPWWSLRFVPADKSIELSRGRRGKAVVGSDDVRLVMGQWGLHLNTQTDLFPWIYLDLVTTHRTHRLELRLSDVEVGFDMLRAYCAKAVGITPDGYVYLPQLPSGWTDLEWLIRCRRFVAGGLGQQCQRLLFTGFVGLMALGGLTAMLVADEAHLSGGVGMYMAIGGMLCIIWMRRGMKVFWRRYRILRQIHRAILNPESIRRPDGRYQMLKSRR